MKRRWKILIVLAIFSLLLAGSWAITVYSGRQYDVEAYKKSLVAGGEKLEIADLRPPAVPPGQNGADLVTQAVLLLAPENYEFTNLVQPMRPIAPGRAVVSFAQPDIRTRLNTNTWPNVIAAAQYNQPATDLLRQEINCSALDFHLDYNNARELQLPQLTILRRVGQILSVETICDLHTGNTPAATTNLCALLALVNGEQNECFLTSQIMRAQLTSMAAATTWELLQSSNLDDARLAMLQKSWDQLELLHAVENALAMDRAMSEASITQMRTSSKYFNQRMSSGGSPGLSRNWAEDFANGWNGLRATYGKWMWRVSWTYADELKMLQDDQFILDTLRATETNGCFDPGYTNLVNHFQDELTNAPDDMIDYQWMYSRNNAGLVSSLGRTLSAEAGRRLVVAAIALKRYQLKYGNYPDDLQSLVPQFVASVPLDPVDAKPLRYKRDDDGTFMLYSIGINGIDDGGDSTDPMGRGRGGGGGYGGGGYMGFYYFFWPNFRALDWVWPQPATPDEIEAYYESFRQRFGP